MACKAAHAACDRGMPCNRCANLGKAAECRESVPLSTLNSSASSSPSTQASSSSTSSSSSSSSTSSSSSSPSSSSSAYQPLHKRQKVAPAFISPAPGPGGTPAPFLLASHAPLAAAAAAVNSNGVPIVPAAHLAGFPPGAFLRPLPLASFFAASPGGGALPAPPTPGQAAAAAWMAAEDRQSGREKEKQETQEMERERAQRAQQREKERERDTEQKEHRLLEKQLERERHMNELVVNLLNEIKLLKTTTRQLRGESEHLRKQIASLQVERKNSPPSEQMEPSFDRPLLISSNSAASWIPYSNPSQPHTMPPVISSVFPPMSEANIAFVVDDDNKPFCLIKRQPLADDRVAIIHSMNAAWTKVLLYTSEELTGQSIRKVVEDASLRESRNRINSFHAQQASAVSKGRSCSPCLHLQPRFIRKDGTTFDALVRQQFFYDAVTREPLWSLLCIDGVRDSEREQHQKFSPCSSPDPLMQRGSPQARPAGSSLHKPSPPSSVSNGFGSGRAGSSRGSADNDDRDEEAAKDNTRRSSSSSSPSPSSTTTGGGDAAERHMYSRDRAEPDSQQGGDADWMTATRMRADDAQRRGGGGGGGGGQHGITNQASDKGNSDGNDNGRMMGWGSSMITDPRQGEGREAGGTSQSQQQQQRRVPPPLSPATLDLLNSLNNIQSWP